MAPSSTKVIVAHVTSAKAAHVTSAKAAHVTSAKASHVTSAKATHVTAAKATHMAATATATHMASTASTAAGLGTRGNKAAGKQCTCQNHHRSSSHNILQLVWADFPPQALSDVGAFQQSERQRRDGLEMAMAILLLH
jgi:hypothetical protein